MPHASKHCFIEEEFGSDVDNEDQPGHAEHQVMDEQQDPGYSNQADEGLHYGHGCEIQVLDEESKGASP